MCFTVSHGNKPFSTLLNVPDNLLHNHEVTKVGVTTRHETSQYMEGFFLCNCIRNCIIAAVTCNNVAADKHRRIRYLFLDRCKRFDTKVGNQPVNIHFGSTGPGINLFCHKFSQF